MRSRGNLFSRRRLTTLALVTAVSTSGTLAVSDVASSAPIASGTPGVSIIAQNGFGDRNNSYAWAMGWFGGKLYVGTGRDELCVENEIVQFYFPSTKQYSTAPSPNVSCPRNPYRMSLQAQIWQYTPPGSTTTTTIATTPQGRRTISSIARGAAGWKLVYRSPLIRNPMAKGRWVARDEAYRGMVVWRDPEGKQALFAAGVSPDEYLPPLLRSHPPVLMRTFDGVHWQTLHMPSVVVHFPNGNDRPMGFRSLMVWRNHLFVTATPDITGDGALMEVTDPWSEHPGLRQVSGPQYDIFEVQTFAGGLYIGTGNKQVGYGVYRTFAYNRSGPFTFHQVVSDGAGRGTQVTSVVSMHVYRHELYVGSSGWYNQGTIPVSELIRISRRGRWELVVGNPRNLPDGTTMYPISGLYDGFFSPFAAHFWRMEDQGGGLYLGTNDWAYTLQQDKRYAWLQETVLAGVLGFNLWATCDGADWFAVTRNAFDANEYNFGGRNLVTGGPQGQDLYIGTANQAQGTTIFDDQANSCGSLINSTRQVPARPGALMTNTLRHGTLLSWQRSADASIYVIERAPFFSVTVGLKAPPTAPDGWHFDDAVPTVTEPGSPGSVTVTLSLPGGFTPVGTTASPSFVDPTPGHYVYEVVAKSALGAGSSPSNVVVAPFGGAPATFASLRSALGAPRTFASLRSALGAPRSRRGPVAVAAAAGSRLEQLLVAAETASARGEYAFAAGDIARLQAWAGGNDELAVVAARVERRLQYAGIAGAP